MKWMKMLVLMVLAVALVFGGVACEKKGGDGLFEDAGEAMDDALEDAGDAVKDAAEDAKDAAKETAEEVKKDVQEAVEN